MVQSSIATIFENGCNIQISNTVWVYMCRISYFTCNIQTIRISLCVFLTSLPVSLASINYLGSFGELVINWIYITWCCILYLILLMFREVSFCMQNCIYICIYTKDELQRGDHRWSFRSRRYFPGKLNMNIRYNRFFQ